MQIISFIVLFFLSIVVNAQYAPEQQREIDSLTRLLEIAEDDTTKIGLRFHIGETGWIFRTAYWDSISNDCIRLLTGPNLGRQKIKVYRTSLGATFNNTGFIYNNQGNISQALKYFHRSLKLYKDVKDKKGVARASNNIGLIYHEQGNIPMALKYYHKALKIREQIGNKPGIANSLNNIGFIYESQDNVPMALMYLKRSLSIYEDIGDKQGVASSSNSIGVILERQGNIVEARSLHEQALIIQEEIGDKDGIANSLINIAEIALIQGDVKLASSYSIRALKLSKELGFPSPISNASKLLSQIAKKEKKYKIGWEHFELFIKMRDSVRNKETEKAVVEQDLKFEFDKQIIADSLLRAEEEKIKELEHKQEINQQKTLIYASVIILLLVLIFSVVVFNRLKISNRQKGIIGQQKLMVELKNQEITDSITYAKRIQEAILPTGSSLKRHLKNGFVLFKPKDIVAGDFYWLEVMDDIVLYAAADCTGHGVPGAMVSVVCHGALNRAVREFKLTEPAQILNKVRELVIETFKTSGEDIKDGMDIALCALNFTTKRLNFSGANNSLYVISNGKMKEIKADKQPIGRYVTSDPFTNHEIQLKEGDAIYVFTDGYADQFGGEKGKKFKYLPFRDLLLNNQDKTMDEQKSLLDKTFEDWKGSLEQVDDVCVIGVRI
ncbi:MAG: hypothetical protein COA97_04030 [Flavobacteriales bacterium]|nr:MAG: hypothetical protein COA97_04030 [Flavobacteriales bacterium]